MKNLLIVILSFLFLAACNKIEYTPKYRDFENAWQRENLIGKVKKLEQYRAYMSGDEGSRADRPVIEFKKEYTLAGDLLRQEFFNNYGELEHLIENKYDEKGFCIESYSENTSMSMKTLENSEFDPVLKKRISVHAVYNDTLTFDAFFSYDKHGNILKQTNIKNGDTTLVKFEYEYDSEDRVVFKKQVNYVVFGGNETTNKFEFDSNGNLIEIDTKSGFMGESRTVYTYDNNNRIRKISAYKQGDLETETLYDELYNMIAVSFYANGELEKVTKYKYKFDKKGNWIQRDAFLKEHSGDEAAVPIFTETREIEYFE